MQTRRFVAVLVLAAPVLALAACQSPTPAQRRVLDSMVGRTPVDVVRTFGVPSRTYSADGHSFLAYIDDQSSYFPGSAGPGWGWGFGGYGWGGGFAGYGGGYGFDGGYGFGGGFPPTYYSSSCQTTFELVGDKVASWSMHGNGC